jgi:hypothetical protein
LLKKKKRTKAAGIMYQGILININKSAKMSAIKAEAMIEIRSITEEYSSAVRLIHAFLMSSVGSPKILNSHVCGPILEIANFANESKKLDNFFHPLKAALYKNV